jgi:4-aminobutyrate aminotransferase-like enzyme
MASVSRSESHSIQHPNEPKSNRFRERLADSEPHALRTYTPSLAFLDRSAGSYHWTPEGRKLADFTSGVLVANLGHNPTQWWQRVLTYLGLNRLESAGEFTEAVPLTAYNAATELELLANERLLANMQREPGGTRMGQVLWAASGSEAIQKALWTALAVDPKRNTIVATRGGFHGKKGLAGAVTGDESDSERDPRVRFISFPQTECENLERRRQPLDLEPYEQELNHLSAELGDRIACLITEPYLGGGGSFHPQPEYLQLLEKFCRDHGALFILDEIQSNFGRTGPMYAFTHYGVEPDIVCLGKGLGNGIPVSAAVGSSHLFDVLGYGAGSDTWSANPLSNAAVLATLDSFESSDILGHSQALAKIIEAGLVRLLDLGLVTNVRGEGCVWGIECAATGSFQAEEVANSCVEACYRGDSEGRAIHLLGPLAGKVLRVSPPLTMPHNEAQEYFDVMYEILASLRLRLA